jgi:ketosteroid isomerase-like protein
MSPTTAHLHQTATSFLAAFENLSATDHLALRAPSCLQIFAPASLKPPAPKTNEDLANHLNNDLRLVLDHFPVTAKEMHVNEAGRQVTIWATSNPKFKVEAMGGGSAEKWDYIGEYVFILDVNDEEKIVRILEFLDSLATERLRGMMDRAKENIGQTGKLR